MKIIAFISQKGGVGKSTLARALAVEASHKKLRVLLADCDQQQATSYHWLQVRKKSKFQVEIFSTAQQALREAPKYDLLIIDGPARTSHATLEIAQKADLVIQPTGATRDDLIPAVKEFNALKKAGIPTKKLLFVPTRLSSSTEAQVIQEYLKKTGYNCSPFYLMEKTSYKQIQNEGKAVSEVIYKSLRKQAQELTNFLLNSIK
jgi:chromosome partitioning protein